MQIERANATDHFSVCRSPDAMDYATGLRHSGLSGSSQTGVQRDLSHSDPFDVKNSIDVEEKIASDDTSVDGLDYKDEALRLVGMERKVKFSDEQYSRVRRKLVSQ